MFIQQDREWKVLPSYKRWMGPSTLQGVQIRFRVRALVDDGHCVWQGWFDDREEYDEFLWSLATGNIRYDTYIQKLPQPYWNPALAENPGLRYEFTSVNFIVSGSTYNNPNDSIGVSGQSGEFVDCIGAGGSGGLAISGTSGSRRASGGGGGAFSRKTSGIVLTPGDSINIGVGAGGASQTSGGIISGIKGGDTFFNGTALAGADVSAEGGGAGLTGASAASGGLASNGIGTTKQSGGNSGASTGSTGVTGGGGCAGIDGDGVASSSAAANTSGNGGNADANADGAASAGVRNNVGSATSSPGGSGTHYDATHGYGAGSGACFGLPGTSGAGGQYGGASGGCVSNTSSTTGKGGDGLIVFAYNAVGLGPLLSHQKFIRIGGGLIQ